MSDKKFILKLLAIATNFIFEVIAAILVGYFIYLLLDRLFTLDSSISIIFMVLGALAAVSNLMRRVYRLGAKRND